MSPSKILAAGAALILATGACGNARQLEPASVRLSGAQVALVDGLSALDGAVALLASGQTAAAEEKLGAALAQLQAAVELTPDDGNARLLLGLVQLCQGDSEKAVASFTAGREAAKAPDKDLRTATELAVERLATAGAAAAAAEIGEVVSAYDELTFRGLDVDRPPLWAAQMDLTVASDSNPDLLAEDFLLEAPDGSLVGGGEADVVGTLRPRFELRPLYDRGDWSLGLAFAGIYSQHGDLDYLDLGAGQVAVTAGHGRSPLGFLEGPLGSVRVPVGDDRVAFVLQGGGDYYWVDGSSYLRRLATAASAVFYFPRLTAATRVDLVAQDRTFFEGDIGDPRRSGRSIGLQVSQTFFFRASDRYLRVGVLAEEVSAERPFEASSIQPSLETHLPLGKRWSFHLAATLRRDDYDHPESDLFNANPLTPSPPREDDTWRLTAMLSRRLTNEVHLGLRLTRTERDSNLNGPGGLSLDYERWVMAMRMSCFLGDGG